MPHDTYTPRMEGGEERRKKKSEPETTTLHNFSAPETLIRSKAVPLDVLAHGDIYEIIQTSRSLGFLEFDSLVSVSGDFEWKIELD